MPDKADSSTRDEFLKHLEPRDLIEFGMIPEFTGRLPVISTLDTLKEGDLVRILTEPRNALTRQFQRLFKLSGAELEFAPNALEAIAKIAIQRETGVRALRSILEDTLRDLLFELPSRTDTRHFMVEGKHVRGEASLARGLTQTDVAEAPAADLSIPEPRVERESA